MQIPPAKSLFTLGLLAASLLPAAAAEPNADQLLREMSTKLAAVQTFRFEATREVHPALLDGHKEPEKAAVSVTVQRPNKLAARTKSNLSTRRFVADGRTLTLSDEKMHHYAIVPAGPTLDAVIAQVDEKYGFTPPLAEFALSNLYADFHRQADTVTYLGLGKTTGGFLGLGGVKCHRLALSGKVADAELWIGVDDRLPHKLVATFKNHPEKPQVQIAFTSWTLGAKVAATEFTYTPPVGAQKIEMWTSAKMQAAR